MRALMGGGKGKKKKGKKKKGKKKKKKGKSDIPKWANKYFKTAGTVQDILVELINYSIVKRLPPQRL